MLAQQGIGDSLQEMLSNVVNFLPLAVAFLAILLIGWFVAKAIAKVVDRVLERVGFDRAVERGGVGRVMARTEYDPSTILAKLVFYTLMLFVLQLAFGIFGPNPISDLIYGLIAFLPRIIVAVVLVVVAAAIANAVRDLVAGSLGGLAYGRTVANLAAGVILVIGVFAALNQLRIAPAIVNGLFYALLAIVVGVTIVAVGGGGIGPMRRQWEKALDRVEEEAPRFREARRGSDDDASTRGGSAGSASRRDLQGSSALTAEELADREPRRDDATVEQRRAPMDDGADDGARSYDELNRDQLLHLAEERDLPGRSSMAKVELVDALRHDDRTHVLRRGE